MNTNADSLELSQRMTVSELEKVMKHLPPPRDTIISLYGNYNIGSLVEQVPFSFPLGSVHYNKLHLSLKNLSPETVLELYKSSENGALPSGERSMQVESIQWYLLRGEHGNPLVDTTIHLNPDGPEVHVYYAVTEPSYISAIRKELEGTPVKLKITVVNLRSKP